MSRLPIAFICGATMLASLSAVAALAGTSATQTTSASMVLTESQAISSQQPVVTGALGMPLTADIARNVNVTTISTVQTAISQVSTTTASSTASAAASVASQARLVPTGINPQSAVQRISTPNITDGSVQQASFLITGDQDRSVSVAIPSAVPLERVGGGDDLQFTTTTSLSRGSLGESRLAEADNGIGQLAFEVGGRVQMRPDLASGAYAGILPVVVQYN